MLAWFLLFSVFCVGGLSIHSNFSTSAAICAMGERGENRNRVTGKESMFHESTTNHNRDVDIDAQCRSITRNDENNVQTSQLDYVSKSTKSQLLP